MNISSWWKNTDTRLQILVGGGVWLFTLVIYCMTMAPTFSFWDCSEFITCSYILGIPHPPGTPLYIIIGRLFSLLPFFTDISVRINFLSALTSSLAVLFGYLTAVRLLRHWFQSEGDAVTRFLVHAGAVCGALFMAFAFTVWNNAVEAEVYGMTTLIMLAMIWLSVLYIEKKASPYSQQLMLLIFFLAFLGTGVHMTSFLVLPVVGLLFVIKHPAPSRIWYALAIYMGLELFLIFVLSARLQELPFYVPAILVGVCYLFYFFSHEKITKTMSLGLVGFILAAFPAISAGLGSLGALPRDVVAPEGTLMPALEAISMIALAGLLVYGIWLLSNWLTLRKKDSTADSTHLVPGLFMAGTIVLTVLLYIPKGYEVFLLLTLAATALLAAVIRRYVMWTMLIAVIGSATLILGVNEFLYSASAAAFLLLVLGFVFKLPGWKSGLVVIGLAVLGFSINGYSYVRSQQDPVINQSEPGKSFKALSDFIERKQYGSQSMIARMFERRAEWENQFGTYRRMGYWGFFENQYGLDGGRFIILFMLGLFALWELVRRTPVNGLPFLLITLIGSVGLILYMNFADGTRINPATGMDYLEVRDRDYFFTPAFVMFGLAIGMGIALAIATVRQVVRNLEPVVQKSIIAVLSVLFLLPTFALAANYHDTDRSRDYIPWDYGFNLLSSCEPNGIIFTNGDNDTFPLWCLQEVYGLRKDVAVINLSLANSPWYINQVQRTLKVDLGMTPEQIDRLRPTQLPSGALLRNYDHAINAVFLKNYGRRPIYFSVTVGADVRKLFGQPIDTLIQLEGMMWRIVPSGGKYRVNIPFCNDYFSDTARFRTRGVNDLTLYKDENTLRMVRNYANGFLMLADTLQKTQSLDTAFNVARLAEEKVPYSADAITFIGRVYAARGDIGNLYALIDTTKFGDQLYLATLLAGVHVKRNEIQTAEGILAEILASNRSFRPAFDGLVSIYSQTNQYTKARALFEKWMRDNPNDQGVASLWQSIQDAARNQSQTPPESSGG